MGYVSVLAGLSAALCWGTADYMSRFQSEKLGYYKTVIFSQVLTLIALVALIPAVDPDLVASWGPLLVLAIGGVLNFVAFNFLYRAFHRGVVSVVAPICYTYPATTAVLSFLILGTVISGEQVVAIAGVIVGVILLSTRFSELRTYLGGKGSARLTAGVGSAVGSSLTFGMVYVGVGYAAPLVSLVIPAIMLRSFAILTGVAAAPALKQDVRPSRRVFTRGLVMMGVLEAVGVLSFTYGIKSPGGSLPIVAAVSGMGGAVAATYGLVFLKERLEPNQFAGVVLALVGVFTLLYLGG